MTSTTDNSAAITAAAPGASVTYAVNYSYDQLNRPVNVSWSAAPTFTAPAASSVAFNHTHNKANQRIGQTVTDNSWFNVSSRGSKYGQLRRVWTALQERLLTRNECRTGPGDDHLHRRTIERFQPLSRQNLADWPLGETLAATQQKCAICGAQRMIGIMGGEEDAKAGAGKPTESRA